jgi:transposase
MLERGTLMEDELKDAYRELIERLSPEKIRERMIKRYLEIKNISKVAEEYHTTRKTVRKWIKRFLSEESLANRSRSPKNPRKHFDSKIKKIIIDFKKQRPHHGYTPLLKYILEYHPEIRKVPSKTMVYNIWREHGLLLKKKRKEQQ